MRSSVPIFQGTGKPPTGGDAVRLLTGKSPGTFCIRHSVSSPGAYGLAAVVPGNGIRHYLVQLTGNQYHVKDGTRFDDIDGLIGHYKSNGSGLAVKLTVNAIVEVPKRPPPRPTAKKPAGHGGGDDAGAKVTVNIPPRMLKVTAELGEGQYGKVYLATWTDDRGGKLVKREVAMKTVKGSSATEEQIREQQREAETMVQLRHPNVVEMLGISLVNGISIVCELVPLGQLNDYLIKIKLDAELSPLDLYRFVRQIAEGMKYMSSMKFVHRDLAARNVLVASKDNVKISDFGLSRGMNDTKDYYRAERKGRWPIKWYAPECLYESLFTSSSDVWSFAVTSWEVFSWGAKPWRGLNARQVVVALHNGERLPKPDDCGSAIYKLLRKCWEEDRKDRPTFPVILEMLDRVYPELKREVERDPTFTKTRYQDEDGDGFDQVIEDQKYFESVQNAAPEEVAAADEDERRVLSKRRLPPLPQARSTLFIPFDEIRTQHHASLGAGRISAAYTATRVEQGGRQYPVSVKAVDTAQCDSKAFLREVEIMVSLDSPWIIRFIGVVSPDEPGSNGHALMISEVLPDGPLDKFLQRRPQPPLSLLRYCTQVAAGLVYLERQKVVHRDLAAHNVLVQNANAVKIAEFGSGRLLAGDSSYYRAQVNGRWPLKWCAPESLYEQTYSHKSDIWSFGIVMWEILSCGNDPYPEMTGSKVLLFIKEGKRLDIPAAFSTAKYRMVASVLEGCWKWNPEDRAGAQFVYTALHAQYPESGVGGEVDTGDAPPPLPGRRNTGGFH